MTTGLGLSAYIDVPAYLRAPTGQETATQVGLNTTTGGASSQPAGTTSLVVASSTGYAAGPAWILDGPTSEVVTVTGSADGTHLTLAAPGTQFAHAPGVSVSQAGTGGCLAETILRASAWIENFCQHGSSGGDRSLFAAQRTERWGMPSARAYIDRDSTVAVMPGHFPVQSVASLTIEFGLGPGGNTLALDVSQLETTNPGRVIEAPYLLAGSPNVGQQFWLESVGLSRSRRSWAVVTYTGGIQAGSVPYDIQQAAVWVTSEFLSQRQNPTGASEYGYGKRKVVQRQRGDLVGDSLLLLRAHDALQPWRNEVWA